MSFIVRFRDTHVRMIYALAKSSPSNAVALGTGRLDDHFAPHLNVTLSLPADHFTSSLLGTSLRQSPLLETPAL